MFKHYSTFRPNSGKKNGAAGLHGLCLLGANSIFWLDSLVGKTLDKCNTNKDFVGVLLPSELLC